MNGRIVGSDLPVYDVRRRQSGLLCRRYPFVRPMEIGRSVLGRAIEGLRIGQPEEAVLLAGGFHGQEWLTAAVLLTFAERLCSALDSGEKIAGIDCCRAMLGRGLIIIPCVNPDGTEIALRGAESAGELSEQVRRIAGEDTAHWSANACGVDINHNFDAGWHILRRLEQEEGINAPASGKFGGAAPESEPETKALADLCRQAEPRAVYAFHSQGEEIYWHYGKNTPKKSALMARVLAAASGYQPILPSGTAQHGGFKDWFIEHFSRPGFTIEIGKGRNPLPMTDLAPVYGRIEEMLMLAVVM